MTFCPVDKSNSIKTRQELMEAFNQISSAVLPYYTEGGAFVKLGNTGFGYSTKASWLEGFSRMLWGLAPFTAGGGKSEVLDKAIQGIINGCNPESEEYWGEPIDYDQRLVEMAAIAYAIMIDPDTYWYGLPEDTRNNLYIWLNKINVREVCGNNWNFFRIMVNLALEKVGMDFDHDMMDKSISKIESMYSGNGWFQDGSHCDFDYYNAMTFHFYTMVYCRERGKTDVERCERYKKYAVEFAAQFRHWYSNEGSAFPFGRSLLYRFAAPASFVGAALAGLEVIPWGEMKYIVLNNLRYWFNQPIFDRDGVLSIGYNYPNLIMTEDYNSPCSPYWAFKIFGVLALPDDHPFWAAEEIKPSCEEKNIAEEVPGFLIQRLENGDHVVALSGRQGKGADWNYGPSNYEGKYSKFAYSSRYGFSIPRNHYTLSHGAFDSMLAVREKDDPAYHARLDQELKAINEDYVMSRWSPVGGVVIDTILIPVSGGHIRIHRIESSKELITVEGGFCIGIADRGNLRDKNKGYAKVETAKSICTIKDLLNGDRNGEISYPEPNTNVVLAKTMLPCLTGEIGTGVSWYACAVYAYDKDHEQYVNVPKHIDIKHDDNSVTVEVDDKKLKIDIL